MAPPPSTSTSLSAPSSSSPPKRRPQLMKDLNSPLALRNNASVASFISIALALTSALAAGVLGVEGWSGFLYYFVGQAVAASALWAKAGGKPEDYSSSPIGLLVGESLGSTSLLTFILFWSLAHNYVHLF